MVGSDWAVYLIAAPVLHPDLAGSISRVRASQEEESIV
jgi:hypothetical protein